MEVGIHRDGGSFGCLSGQKIAGQNITPQEEIDMPYAYDCGWFEAAEGLRNCGTFEPEINPNYLNLSLAFERADRITEVYRAIMRQRRWDRGVCPIEFETKGHKNDQ